MCRWRMVDYPNNQQSKWSSLFWRPVLTGYILIAIKYCDLLFQCNVSRDFANWSWKNYRKQFRENILDLKIKVPTNWTISKLPRVVKKTLQFYFWKDLCNDVKHAFWTCEWFPLADRDNLGWEYNFWNTPLDLCRMSAVMTVKIKSR